MQPAFEYGDEVRLVRNVRNDGTYPGMEVGAFLIRRGEIGCVYDVGTYLQDQLIYRVHFLGAGRTVGCREDELIPVAAPWIPSQFEFRESVVARVALSIHGCVVVDRGQTGRVEKVLRDCEGGVQYHVYFANGKTLQVPETALDLPEARNTAGRCKPHVDD